MERASGNEIVPKGAFDADAMHRRLFVVFFSAIVVAEAGVFGGGGYDLVDRF